MHLSLAEYLGRAESEAHRHFGVGCAVVTRGSLRGQLAGAATVVCDEKARLHPSLLGPRGQSLWLASPEAGLAAAAASRLDRDARPLRWVETVLPEELLSSATAPSALWSPDSYLLERAPSWPRSRVFDLGCGSGRDAVYLAQLGHRVVGIDRLPDALALARTRAQSMRVEVEWRTAKLDGDIPFEFEGPSVLVAIRLQRPDLVANFARRLSAGSRLLVRGLSSGGPKSAHRRFDLGRFVENLGPGWEWFDGPRQHETESQTWVEVEALRCE